MRMASPQSSDLPKNSSPQEDGCSGTNLINNVSTDDDSAVHDDSAPDSEVCRNDPTSNVNEISHFNVDIIKEENLDNIIENADMEHVDSIIGNVDNIKEENVEDKNGSNHGDTAEVVLDDPATAEESSNVEEGTLQQVEGHFVEVDTFGFDEESKDDNESDINKEEAGNKEMNKSKVDDDVEIISTENNSFKPTISIRRESELKAKQVHGDNKGANNAALYESHSETGPSGVQETVVYSEDESITSVHSDECFDEAGSAQVGKQSSKKKSNLAVLPKGNLKRKNESAKTAVKPAVIKKQKIPISAGSTASSSKKHQAQVLTPTMPALGGLRNIIGSNFKKLKLTINEPYDMKNELGLSYKHEDPSLDTAASNLNADGTAYECPKCGANFKWKTTLKFHMFNHLEDKALECNVCFKLFLSPAYLHEHKKVHLFENQDRNFNCQDCSGQFESEASLTTHKLSHAQLDQKHYVCNVCKERFASLFSLNSHKAKHSSAIKYECKPCDLRFKTLKTLTKHIATHNVELKITENEQEQE